LNPARLPIPPPRQIGTAKVKKFLITFYFSAGVFLPLLYF